MKAIKQMALSKKILLGAFFLALFLVLMMHMVLNSQNVKNLEKKLTLTSDLNLFLDVLATRISNASHIKESYPYTGKTLTVLQYSRGNELIPGDKYEKYYFSENTLCSNVRLGGGNEEHNTEFFLPELPFRRGNCLKGSFEFVSPNLLRLSIASLVGGEKEPVRYFERLIRLKNI
ncbi:MAG: hypothetical protein GX221_08460 [Candidatus Riflebacteria bacterium]|nr:hypothetical protein [Candidatus Riflebacteria bacterium]